MNSLTQAPTNILTLTVSNILASGCFSSNHLIRTLWFIAVLASLSKFHWDQISFASYEKQPQLFDSLFSLEKSRVGFETTIGYSDE